MGFVNCRGCGYEMLEQNARYDSGIVYCPECHEELAVIKKAGEWHDGDLPIYFCSGEGTLDCTAGQCADFKKCPLSRCFRRAHAIFELNADIGRARMKARA